MTKHTPTPWGIIVGDAVPIIVFSGKNGAMVASLGSLLDDDESMANAKLMAAAPDLLESLANIVDWIKQGDFAPEFLNAAELAILKATGEQK